MSHMPRPTPHSLDDAALEYLASSLLCDDTAPPSVHDHWRRRHAADAADGTDIDDGTGGADRIVGADGASDTDGAVSAGSADRTDGADEESAAIAQFPQPGSPNRLTTAGTRTTIAAAAATIVVIVSAGAWLTVPGSQQDEAGSVGDGASSRTITQPDIDLAALGPAVGGAMGEKDFGGLLNPRLAAQCLASHGESEDALLGAAPMAHGGGVGQLFVLSTGMRGRVSVLLTMNTCGAEPAPPVVHRTIGAPG